MPKLGKSGSVRGALSNERPYRDTQPWWGYQRVGHATALKSHLHPISSGRLYNCNINNL
jgi:hypothetical protein